MLSFCTKEVHKEKFKDDAERRSVAIGYVIIMVCNGLSVWSLAQYMFNGMPPAVELDYELAFLVIKTIIEMMTNKFSWPLLLHHTATFIGIAFFSKHEDLQCVTWVVVHQQLVHFPFMVRAAWRLTCLKGEVRRRCDRGEHHCASPTRRAETRARASRP